MCQSDHSYSMNFPSAQQHLLCYNHTILYIGFEETKILHMPCKCRNSNTLGICENIVYIHRTYLAVK